jgi:hypothetical protein
LRRFRNVKEVRVHLIRRGFKERYTKLIWYGDNTEEYINVGISRDILNSETIVHDESGGENIENFEPVNDVRDDSGGENVQNLDNPYCMKHNDNLDEKMNDGAMDFVVITEVFINLCSNSNIPLYPDCMKFMKISAVFKLYNLKAKNEWSDKNFISLLQLLGDILPDNNELSDSTYKAKKLLCPLSMKVERIHTYPNDCILY